MLTILFFNHLQDSPHFPAQRELEPRIVSSTDGHVNKFNIFQYFINYDTITYFDGYKIVPLWPPPLV
ncbi:MAG: hypothetical protein LBV77_02780 [Candidatus Adiutrix intracellularis]|nr:hypothetical protein [Candidatus Adiutrix intracellularis]